MQSLGRTYACSPRIEKTGVFKSFKLAKEGKTSKIAPKEYRLARSRRSRHFIRLWGSWLAAGLCLACVATASHRDDAEKARVDPEEVTISIVGTNDLHGHVDRTAVLAGYVANLRNKRAADGGDVLLVDGGDLFQGTLESNLGEGAVIVEAYNALGYDAATVGNHEFDFGPEGKAATATGEQDPRGALKARARQATFPFLSANIVKDSSGERFGSPLIPPSVLLEKKGVKIGLIGVSTEDTPYTTLAANFRGLSMRSVRDTLLAEARKLRAEGASLVVALAHAGGHCASCHDAEDTASCDADDEIFQVANQLPAGSIDVIVAGHTHASVAHRVNGIAIIESWSLGRGFGRVDVRVAPGAKGPASMRIFQPTELCERPNASLAECSPGPYEGQPVIIDSNILNVIQPAFDFAEKQRNVELGVKLVTRVPRGYTAESPLGNLFADLMLRSNPAAEVAITNSGGLRADLPEGILTYGSLFEAMPFDNRFAFATVKVKDLEAIIAKNLEESNGFLLISGVRAVARCQGGTLQISVEKHDGQKLDGNDALRMVTSDFLAGGGDSAFSPASLTSKDFEISDVLIRDAMIAELQKQGGNIGSNDPGLFSQDSLRISYPGVRPLRCEDTTR